MARLLIAVVAIGAILWSWDRLVGLPGGCSTIAYPLRCSGAVIGNECHGQVGEALARREFVVDPAAQRVTESGGSTDSHARCRVVDCRQWECMDEIFLRTARDGQFREQLRPGLTAVDPRKTLSVVYGSAWQWWAVRAEAAARRALAAATRK
jgi:hypothetical protein